MTPDEQRRADLVQFAITSHLGDRLTASKRNAELAAGAPDADQRKTEWRQASDRLHRWLAERQLDQDTVVEVSNAFLQAMEDGFKLVMHTGEGGEADTYITLRQRAAVTRDWMRDQGYSVPVYPSSRDCEQAP
ncbi:hypothetical protein [Streptomyces chartreusis]|uniref:hypothetical protein n=1 Tax=Streptomyces chartreusis TaxID=1969 RepID=UPI0037F2308A